MRIIGAGMAGLLAANVLRRHKPTVHERQSSLPDNHAALLRFRTDAVSKATGIPFRRVDVQKAVMWQGTLSPSGNLAANNMYAQKVTGRVSNRSIINTASGERFIAPNDFIGQLAANAHVALDSPLDAGDVIARTPESEPMISTLPMPIMMDMVGWTDRPVFGSRPIWVVTATVEECDIYQTVYYPESGSVYYRASMTGNRLTIECMAPPVWPEKDCADVVAGLGINGTVVGLEIKEQKYGKLVPLADAAAGRKFLLFLTDRYRIYSLGRFATWRNLLLDDVVKDIHTIEKLIEFRDGYKTALAQL